MAVGAAPPSSTPATFGVSAWQCVAVARRALLWSRRASVVLDIFQLVSNATDRVADSSILVVFLLVVW